MAGPKTRNNNRWTEARFNSFIKGNLRNASRKWQPINEALAKARVARGEYLCAECKETVPATVKEGRARVKNVHVDHIDPVIDPAVGFETWDMVIERLFVEGDKLQVLCTACHKIKCDVEKNVAKERRLRLKEEKEEDE